MKKQRVILLATVFVLLVPLIVLALVVYIGKTTFANKDFWLAYMAYFGTVAVSGTALWQNSIIENNNKKERAELERKNIVLENTTSEHPLLKITGVKLYGPIGKKLTEEYRCSEHQENYYIGTTKLRGKLEIRVQNIGNGLAREINHRGLSGFEAKDNSKSIVPNSEGVILLYFKSVQKANMVIDICYQNIRNFQYSQKINIIIDDTEYFDEEFDENGYPIPGTEKLTGIDTTVYVILGAQKPLEFVKDEDVDNKWNI